MLGIPLVFVDGWWLTGVKDRSQQPQAVKWVIICQRSRRCKVTRGTKDVWGEFLVCGNGLAWHLGLSLTQGSSSRKLVLCRVTNAYSTSALVTSVVLIVSFSFLEPDWMNTRLLSCVWSWSWCSAGAGWPGAECVWEQLDHTSATLLSKPE